MAQQAYRVLHNWKRLPGASEDGSADEESLRQWCDAARRLSEECGRLEVCDDHRGQLFAQFASTYDEEWSCKAGDRVAGEIETESLESGLLCGILNSRGAVFRASGRGQERELAAKFSQLAERVRFDAPFVGGILANVAECYEKRAADEDERERWRG